MLRAWKRSVVFATCLLSVGFTHGADLSDVVLLDFESDDSLGKVAVRDLTHLERTSAWHTDGTSAGTVRYEAWSEGRERWPAIIVHRNNGALKVSDFRPYRYLCWDAHNPGTAPAMMTIHLRDGKQRRFSRRFQIEPGASLSCKVAVSDLGLDAADITEIHFYTTEPPETYTIYLDALRLSSGLRKDLRALEEDVRSLSAALRGRPHRIRRDTPVRLAELEAEFGSLVKTLQRLSADILDGEKTATRDGIDACREALDKARNTYVDVAGVLPLLDAWSMARRRDAEGFLLIPESSMVKVPLETAYGKWGNGEAIELELARNEREHAQAVVIPFAQDLTGVTWNIAPALGPRNRTVPLTVRLVGYVDCRQPSYAVARTGWWPDPLLESQTTVDEVPLGEVCVLWISATTASDTLPGRYESSLTVSAEGLPSQTLPVRLHVWDFELPDHTSLRTALSWRGLSTRLYAKERIPELTEAYENRMQREYRLNVGTIYGGPPTWSVARLRELHAMGLNAINLAYVNAPREPAFDEAAHWQRYDELVARIKAYMPTIEAAGVRDLCYIYCFDERPSDQLDVVFETARRLKAIWPDIEVMTTAYDGTFGLERDGGDAIDIWVPLTPRFDTNAERIAEARRQGRDIWWYICIGPSNPYANWFVEYTAIEPRLIMGAMTAKYEPGGFLYYAVNRWPLNDRVITAGPRTDWNPASYRNNNGDGSIMCAGPDGPLATIRLENIRDGIEDYEYYVLLRKLLAARPGLSGPRQVVKRVASGLRLGIPADAGAVPESVVKTLNDFTYDPDVLRAERRRVARTILRLKKDLGS